MKRGRVCGRGSEPGWRSIATAMVGRASAEGVASGFRWLHGEALAQRVGQVSHGGATLHREALPQQRRGLIQAEVKSRLAVDDHPVAIAQAREDGSLPWSDARGGWQVQHGAKP